MGGSGSGSDTGTSTGRIQVREQSQHVNRYLLMPMPSQVRCPPHVILGLFGSEATSPASGARVKEKKTTAQCTFADRLKCHTESGGQRGPKRTKQGEVRPGGSYRLVVEATRGAPRGAPRSRLLPPRSSLTRLTVNRGQGCCGPFKVTRSAHSAPGARH